MSDLSTDRRAKLGATLIQQSPPGEVNDVINAIRSIVADDEALMVHAGPALRSYNLAQLTVVEHPAQGTAPAHTSLLSDAAMLPGSGDERYIDATGKQSFTFDHVNMAAGGYEAYELPEEEESFRTALAKSLAAYTKNHFSTGQSSVNCSQFPLLPPAPTPPAVPIAEADSSSVPSAEDAGAGTAGTLAPSAEPEAVVTDVVPAQIGTGSVEPAPTPAVGETSAQEEDVVEPGNLAKVDEAVEEVKAEDGSPAEGSGPEKLDVGGLSIGLASEAASGEGGADQPEVTELGGASKSDDAAAEDIEQPAVAETSSSTAQPVEERKQERQDDPTYTLEVVGNRYKTDAYWTGRWRTRWTVNKAANSVAGTIQVDVHYFEQGNVQLATKHDASFPYPADISGQSIASQIVTTISKIEAAYQSELQDVYGDLGDKAFRSLRRALPVTRQKVDWEKVGGYSLGSDISKARA